MAATTSYLIHVFIPEFAPEADPQDPCWEEFFLNPGSTVPERILSEKQQKLLPPDEFQKRGHFWCSKEDWGGMPGYPGTQSLLGAKGVLAITKVIEGPKVRGGRQKIVIL